MAKPKLRSRAYPAIPLGEAVELQRNLTERLGWGRRDRDTIARAMGYAGGNSGIAARKIAALVHFGLQSLQNGHYSPTELAKRILEGKDPDPALREACSNPALFRDILYLYKPVGRVPVQLAMALVSDHGIQDHAKNEVASIFMASTVYAGILDADGTFRGEPAETVKRTLVPALYQQSSAPPSAGSQTAPPPGDELNASEDDQVLEFSLTDKKRAKFYLPGRLNEQDILLLRKQIEFLELQVQVNRPDQPVRLDLFRGDRRR
jgi:hypothetical protein